MKISRSEAKRELYRRDYGMFAREQLWIRNVAGGSKTLLRFNASQVKLWTAYKKALALGELLWFIILKSRQIGSTTFWEGLGFTKCLLNPYTNGLVAAHDTETTIIVFKIAKFYLKHLARELRPKMKSDRKDGFDFDSDSTMLVQTAGNINLGAAQTLQYVHLTEVGRMERGEELRSSLYPAIHKVPGNIFVMESTARGAKTFFHNEWLNAKAGKGHFKPLFFPWYEHEEYCLPSPAHPPKLTPYEEEIRRAFNLTYGQLLWRRKELESYKGDEDLFRESYPIDDLECWRVSGKPLYARDKLRTIRERSVTRPLAVGEMFDSKTFVPMGDGCLLIWEHPKKELQYVAGADVAEGGVVGDYSAIVVLETRTRRQVAEWRGRCDEITLARNCNDIGGYYNTALVAVETNGPGRLAQHELAHRHNYVNCYTRITYGSVGAPVTKVLGWKTNVDTKPKMVALSRLYVNRAKIIIRSQWLMDELECIIDEGRASVGSTDDRWIAWMIALQLAYGEADEESGAELPQQEQPAAVREYAETAVMARDIPVYQGGFNINSSDRDSWENL